MELSVKRITEALAAVDKARLDMDTAKATYNARREILKEAQAALEDAIRAETSPTPLFDQPTEPARGGDFKARVGSFLGDIAEKHGLQVEADVPLPADQADEDPDLSEPPEEDDRHQRHEEWVRTVRDPATVAAEPEVEIVAKPFRLTYQLANLPDGRVALTCHFERPLGGMGRPWAAYASRAEAMDRLATMARCALGTAPEADHKLHKPWRKLAAAIDDLTDQGGRVTLGPDCRARVKVADGHVVDLLWDEPSGVYEATPSQGFETWRDPDSEAPSPTQADVAAAVSVAVGRSAEVVGVGFDIKGKPTFGLRPLPRPAQPWDGAASDPDAWRHQGVGLALRTLPVPTVQKLAAAGLSTIGALADFAAETPGEMRAIKGLGAKATADVYLALDTYLESREGAADAGTD